MNRCLLNIMGLALMAIAVTSCGPKAGLNLDQIASDARQMAQDGRVDQALVKVESFYNSRHYKASKPMLLSILLQIEVNADRLDAAQKRFLNVAVESPEVAAQSLGIIENDLFLKKDFQNLINWCDKLLTLKLGDAALSETANKHLMALSSLGRTGEIATVIGIYLPKLSESAAIGLVNVYFSAAVKDRQWDLAESLLRIMDKMLPASSEKQTAKVSFSMDLLLAKGNWKEADSYFRGEMNKLSDSGAARNLRVVGAAEVAVGETGAADSLYEFGLVDDLTRPLLREAAAMGWVSSVKRGSPLELVRRLTKLQTKKLPVDVTVNLISMNYTGLIPSGTTESFDALNRLCETLRADTRAEMCLRQLDGILLDISYFRQDYEGSLKIIERGLVPGDPTKKDMMISKVNAHIALKKGDYRGAITHFQKFMDVVMKDDEDTYDPIEQIQVSSDMILGLNARRIGDLWIKAGSAEEAAKAYEEARQHYTKALKKFPDPASGENKKIVQEMRDIPKG